MSTTKKRKKRTTAKRPAKRKAKRKTRKVGAVKRKAMKRKTAKRKPAKRKKRSGRRVVKQVERRSVERVLSGKRKRKKAPGTRRKRKARRVVMAGSSRRRRVGGNGGGMKWLVPVAIGAGLLYLLTKKNSPATPGGVYQLPPLTTTQNQVRNNQSQDLLNYAVAGGLAIETILKLIDKLNTSNDQQVQNIYDVYHSTGNLDGVYV